MLSLVEAERQERLGARLAFLRQPSLLIVDEIGYLPVTASGTNLFFQPVNSRYEKASMVLTSNKGFKEWGDIFGDPVAAAAVLDRLLHHCHIVNIRGPPTACASTQGSFATGNVTFSAAAVHIMTGHCR